MGIADRLCHTLHHTQSIEIRPRASVGAWQAVHLLGYILGPYMLAVLANTYDSSNSSSHPS